MTTNNEQLTKINKYCNRYIACFLKLVNAFTNSVTLKVYNVTKLCLSCGSSLAAPCQPFSLV